MRVLAEETLSSTNVHFRNPVVDRQAAPSTQTPFTPHAGVTIASLELYTWTYTSGPSSASIWARRDIWRRASCGDVKLPDRHDRQTRRQPAIFIAARQFHESATTLTSEPSLFSLPTCSVEKAPPGHVQDTSSHPMTWSVQGLRKSLNYSGLTFLLFITYYFIYTPSKSNGGFQTASNSKGFKTVRNSRGFKTIGNNRGFKTAEKWLFTRESVIT